MRLRALIPALAVGLLAPLAPLAPQATARTAPAAEPSPATWYETQKPAWKHCGGTAPARFQCATLQMPLDYRRPDGPTIGVAISRLATSTPEQRRGVLLFNPGGPGGSGLEDPLLFAKDLPRSVLERYDLIGFDPRGVGRSSPLNCGLDEDEKAGGFWSPYKPETEQRDIARSRSIAEKCRAREGERVPHISTRNTARDMDVIRAVLGERKISYIGVSYGTYLGAVYTQMFPHRADRFILDSAVDPTLAWRGMFRTWGPEAETAFTRWTRWTAARDARYDLGGTPAQVRDTFWGLVRKAERTPISLHGREWNGDAIRLLRPTFFSVKEGADAMANLRRASLGLPVGPAPATP
ncbi:alpha/beta fold hydrolase, partial [Streptomyces clavuligerus]